VTYHTLFLNQCIINLLVLYLLLLLQTQRMPVKQIWPNMMKTTMLRSKNS